MLQTFIHLIGGILLFCSGLTVQAAVALGPVDGAGLPPTDRDRVRVGTLAPDFTLEDEKGAAVTLSDFRGKKNVVLVFYRGHW